MLAILIPVTSSKGSAKSYRNTHLVLQCFEVHVVLSNTKQQFSRKERKEGRGGQSKGRCQVKCNTSFSNMYLQISTLLAVWVSWSTVVQRFLSPTFTSLQDTLMIKEPAR